MQHRARLEANHVYVIPPDTYIALHDGGVLHEPLVKRHGIGMPVGHFFHSLAESSGERPIGIVPPGTGSDGAAGRNRGGERKQPNFACGEVIVAFELAREQQFRPDRQSD